MKYSAATSFRILFDSFLLAVRFIIIVPYAGILYAFRNKTRNTKNTSGQDSPDSIPLFLWSQVIWSEVWQRPQEFASRLSKKRPVIYFSPVQIHRRYDSLKYWKHIEEFKDGKGLVVASPLVFPGEYKLKLIAAINRILIESEIKLLTYKYPEIVFETNSPFVGDLAKKFDPALIVYDVIDDFISFKWSPSNSAKLEEELFSITDLTFTGTNTLLEKKSKFHKDIHFIQCGVKFEMFNAPKSDKIPDDIKNAKKPLLGYTGSISDRTDAELISMLAQAFPQCTLVMIGPIHGSFGTPPEAANILYLGLKPHDTLPVYLRHFDVCLMPFRLTEAALAINPVKTLEYLAAGKPVISTAIPDVVKFYSGIVAIAESKEHFIELTRQMLETDQSDRIKQGVERARNSSWDTMTDQMNNLITDRLKRKAGAYAGKK